MDQRAWHTMTVEGVADQLHTNVENGLRRREVNKRRQRYGLNKLIGAKKASAARILADQFKSLVVLLLLIAAVVSFVMNDKIEAIAIATVIFLNAGIGFVVELRANRAMEALQKLGVQETVVVRNGRRVEVNAQDLVPGDLVEYEAGDSITADCRLVEAAELRIVESALTGESVPVSKNIDPLEDPEGSLGDRSCMLYKATSAVTGSARAIVVATGMSTEVGKIAELVSKEKEEETPLEARLRRLGRSLIVICLAVAAVVIVAGMLRGEEKGKMIMTGLALAIAAVPEGLPAVATIALAVGMRRMARRNALIRRLPAVETLGSASVICSDKTGTLTENEMTAVLYYLADGPLEVTGTGYAPEGEFQKDGANVDPAQHGPLKRALLCGALCSNASLGRNEDSGEWAITGDPTEAALVVAAAKAGLDQERLRDEYEQIQEHPFSSDTARMATAHKDPAGGVTTFVKGAPDRIYGLCSAVLTPDGERPFDNEQQRTFAAAQEAMSGRALRVLAFAFKTAAEETEPYEGLTFVGLVGLLDPPREEVASAIEAFKEAGIRTVMITGDHPATAQAIGRTLGIIDDDDDAVLAGRELHDTSPEDLAARVDAVSIYARVSPEDKVKIVDALRSKGNVVAMLGDGVNDAAALKAADIGVAMGIEGTDVAKETSDIVLLDDRFVTVTAAVEEGRVVLTNIKKFIYYLFSCNLSEVLTVFIGTISGMPLPLLPLQILWLNLITDIFPALSLAVEPAETGLMKRAPRPVDQPIFSRRIKMAIGGYGLLIAAVTLGAFAWGLRYAPPGKDPEAFARTICFMTMALSQLFHAWTSRKDSAPIRSVREFLANRYMLGAAVLTIGLQILAITLPALNKVLGTVRLSVFESGVVLGLSLVPVAVGQAIRWVFAKRNG
ncbi:MAG: cation-transporting P-type ATPase [Planctomycetes bacterium]|nr:cation-transporting P-type ATPase [Planctomycetota bacterium]